MSAAADIVWAAIATWATCGQWVADTATTVPWGPLAVVTACAYIPAALLHAADRRRARHAERTASGRLHPHTAAALQQAIHTRPEPGCVAAQPEPGTVAWLEHLYQQPAHHKEETR
jgi:hypothetical protein